MNRFADNLGEYHRRLGHPASSLRALDWALWHGPSRWATLAQVLDPAAVEVEMSPGGVHPDGRVARNTTNAWRWFGSDYDLRRGPFWSRFVASAGEANVPLTFVGRSTEEAHAWLREVRLECRGPGVVVREWGSQTSKVDDVALVVPPMPPKGGGLVPPPMPGPPPAWATYGVRLPPARWMCEHMDWG